MVMVSRQVYHSSRSSRADRGWGTSVGTVFCEGDFSGKGFENNGVVVSYLQYCYMYFGYIHSR
jgi:hypothetical protein